MIGRLVDDLKLDDFIVVGQNWGGPIGMTVALERADLVAELVFANTWYWPAKGGLVTFSLVMSSPPVQWLISTAIRSSTSSCRDRSRTRCHRKF